MSGTTPQPSNGAREAIFAAIRQSLNESRPFDDEWQKHHRSMGAEMERADHAGRSYSESELVDNFRQSLESVAGNCYVVSNKAEAASCIGEITTAIAATRIAVSDSPLVNEIMPSFNEAEIVEMADAAVLFGCDLGITSAQWAIAETGTLVLESDRERHRLTSLVPPVHICVIEAGNIRQTLAEILEILKQDLNRTVTFITGASRTSDIELTLAIGVHGPEQLHVIVIAD